MSIVNRKTEQRKRIKAKVRANVSGTATRPRLSVFRSNKYLYAQLIDDTTGTTLVAASDVGSTEKSKADRAKEIGKTVAEKAKEKGITAAVFDRNGYRYTGRIRALADGARSAGLTF